MCGALLPVTSERGCWCCRRRFVAELLMSLHDSPLADAAMRGVALQTICSAPASAPMYAADLVQHAGAKFPAAF